MNKHKHVLQLDPYRPMSNPWVSRKAYFFPSALIEVFSGWGRKNRDTNTIVFCKLPNTLPKIQRNDRKLVNTQLVQTDNGDKEENKMIFGQDHACLNVRLRSSPM